MTGTETLEKKVRKTVNKFRCLPGTRPLLKTLPALSEQINKKITLTVASLPLRNTFGALHASCTGEPQHTHQTTRLVLDGCRQLKL